MAGLNTRFHDVGFDLPKYLLPWNNTTILDCILAELTAAYRFSSVFLIANKRELFFRDRLQELAVARGIPSHHVVFISDTRGQAHTAAVGAQIAKDIIGNGSEPIAFHNSDTIITARDFKSVEEKLKDLDAYIDIFPASSPSYSYVAIEGGAVRGIAEKKVISPFASSGFYAFRSVDTYLAAFNAAAQKGGERPTENYITDVLRDMMESGRHIFVNELNQSANTIVLGTPQEYGIEMARRVLMG